MFDIDYERGLIRLEDIVKRRTPDRLTEFQVLQSRMLEVLQEEKLYGSDENTRSRKSRVVDALATLTREVIEADEIHFIDLCKLDVLQHPLSVEKQPSSPFSQSIEQWSGGTEITIQDASYLLHEPPRIEETWSLDHSVVCRRAKAQQLSRNRMVWLKQVHIQKQTPTASSWRDTLQKEARLLTQLEDERQQDFPRLLSLSHSPQTVTLVYTFTTGNSLAQVFGPCNKPLDAYHIRPLLQSMQSLCKMLGVLHSKHMAYRTLTPHNILLIHGNHAVLQDVGIAAQPFTLGEGLGLYQAPEQIRMTQDKAIPGPHTDIYRLGAILYHILTGHTVSSLPVVLPSA